LIFLKKTFRLLHTIKCSLAYTSVFQFQDTD